MTKILIFLCIVSSFFSCSSVSLYTLNVKYTPPESAVTKVDACKYSILTVAMFNDLRTVEDKALIGNVVFSDGSKIPILPKYLKPVDAVTFGIREYLSVAGYTVSSESPAWDLQDNTINKEWGTVLVGGTIDRFEVTCYKEGIKKRYQTKVKLTVVFADVKKSRVFYTIKVETNPSLIHVRFSEEMLEKQINEALSDAIERVFGNKETMQEIREKIEKKIL